MLVHLFGVRINLQRFAADADTIAVAATLFQSGNHPVDEGLKQIVVVGLDGHDPHFGRLQGQEFAVVQFQRRKTGIQIIPLGGADVKGFKLVRIQRHLYVGIPPIAAVFGDQEGNVGITGQLVHHGTGTVDGGAHGTGGIVILFVLPDDGDQIFGRDKLVPVAQQAGKDIPDQFGTAAGAADLPVAVGHGKCAEHPDMKNIGFHCAPPFVTKNLKKRYL